MIRYKVYNEQHPRAGQNTQHVLYEQQARAGQNTPSSKSKKLIINKCTGMLYPIIICCVSYLYLRIPTIPVK